VPSSSKISAKIRALRPIAALSALLVAAAAGCAKDPAKDRAATAGKDGGAAVQLWPANAPSKTWNATQIDWLGFDEGVRRATQENKPILLVVYTTWCPHCRNYSHVFDDPRVVDRARDFVMVKVDSDAEPHVAGRYARDGGYIPRTYFLAPDGTAYVDLANDVLSEFPPGIETETLAIYSLVDSIAMNIPSVKRVKFLIQGQEVETLDGHADLTVAFAPDPTRIKSGP